MFVFFKSKDNRNYDVKVWNQLVPTLSVAWKIYNKEFWNSKYEYDYFYCNYITKEQYIKDYVTITFDKKRLLEIK